MITTNQILLAFGLTLAGVLVHVLWWRIRRPKDDVWALIVCLLVFPFLLASGWILTGTHDSLLDRLLDLLVVGVLTALLGSAYIVSYPGAQAGSPTMLILLAIARRGTASKEELLNQFDDAALCHETFGSLVNEKFAHREGDRLIPAPRGLSMLRICQTWRRVLGAQDGKG